MSSGSGSGSYSKASAVLPRMVGRDTRSMPGARALRGLGAAEEGLLARPERPRRCTLPITALRVTPPSSAAIWLADKPSAHSFFRSSTLSSVQLIGFLHGVQGVGRNPPVLSGTAGVPDAYASGMTRNRLPHEMSYRPAKKLQYAVDRMQALQAPKPQLPTGFG